MKFLHLSDLHIHGDSSNNKKVAESLKFITKTYPQHKIIITGDITDDGSPEQYGEAFKMLHDFKNRIFICPGNHDFGAVGNLYSEERALRFDRELAIPLNQGGTFKGDNTPVVNVVRDKSTEVVLIALDSNLETHFAFDFACGAIGNDQLNNLKTILDNLSSGSIKLLFFHHHPFVLNDPFMEMKDAKELAQVIYGRVDIVAFGHKHEMKQWENRWGAKFMLASDNSSDKDFAKEITVDGTNISVSPIRIR